MKIEISLNRIRLREEILSGFSRFMRYYVTGGNSKRLDQKLGYKTPDQIDEMYRNGKLEQLSSKSETQKTSS
jgi:hypothetical protein